MHHPPHNLPVPLTSFVGRESELGEVTRLLGSARLLTLTGAGGIGKTRLALQVAHEVLNAYADGVWLVELGALADPALVPQAIAAVFGVPEQPGRPVADALADALAHREALLVLDNCEHMVAAAAEIADALLRSCPSLRFLATSREPLSTAGEVTWLVPSLGLLDEDAPPSLATLQSCEATRLFVERARAALPSFSVTDKEAAAITGICRRLDGIPLAIELAAARVRALTPANIAARLDDRFHLLTGGARTAPLRQQTLRATLEWSSNLLSEPERRVFDRLSIFAGGCTLEAAEAVCAGDGVATNDVLDLIARLVDRSLLLAERSPEGAGRYRLLETLRQWAQDRLAATGYADRLRDRHAAYFLAVAEGAAPHLVGIDDQRFQAALEQLTREHDNLRAALRWLVTCNEVDRAQRLGGALRYFWFFQGYLSEGRAWLAELLSLQASATPTSGRARVLSGASMLTLLVGDYDTSWTMGREAVTLWEELDNPLEHALALVPLGSVTGIRGDRTQARVLHQRGVELSRAAGSRVTEALHLHGLSELAFADGDYAQARARANEALAVPRELGWTHPRNSPQILGMLGDVSVEAGDLTAARAHFEESLAKARETGWGWGIALALVRVAHVAIEQGDEDRAGGLLTEGLLSHRAHGNRAGILSCLEACAHLEATRGHAEQALRLAGLAAAMRDAIHAPASPTEQRRLDRWLEPAGRSLGDQTADEVLPQAHAESVELAVEDALAALNRPLDQPIPPDGRSRARSSTTALTRREQEVAALVALGQSNLAIADALVISERTVEAHVRNMLGKLRLNSRVQLATWAVAHQIVGASPNL